MAYKIIKTKMKKLSKKDKSYFMKLKRRFDYLDSIPYSQLSQNDLDEMEDLQKEMYRLEEK